MPWVEFVINMLRLLGVVPDQSRKKKIIVAKLENKQTKGSFILRKYFLFVVLFLIIDLSFFLIYFLFSKIYAEK